MAASKCNSARYTRSAGIGQGGFSFGAAFLFDASFQDAIRRSKNALCATLWNRGTGKPALNVSTAIFRSVHSQGFETEQSNGLGLNFFQISRQGFGIVNRFGCMV